MGHSSSINANIYQAPLAEAEIIKVGSQLQKMDGQHPDRDDVNPSTIIQDVILSGSETDTERPLQIQKKAVNKEGESPDIEPNAMSEVKTKQKRKRALSASSDSDSETERPLQVQTRTANKQKSSSSSTLDASRSLPVQLRADSNRKRSRVATSVENAGTVSPVMLDNEDSEPHKKKKKRE